MPSILVVDDDESTRDTIYDLLSGEYAERFSGFSYQ